MVSATCPRCRTSRTCRNKTNRLSIVHRLFTIICIIFCLVLQGCKNQQGEDNNLMTIDAVGIGLCDYFDGRGTPNERMLAHYILARTYIDMDEVPQALEELQKAMASADTTAADCDRRLLARVHHQAHILLEQSEESSHPTAWLVVSIGLFIVLCGAGLLFFKKKKKLQVTQSDEENIYETEAYLRFRDQSKHPQQSITREDWQALEAAIDTCLPDFRKKVDPNRTMKDTDYYICMLIRLHFSPSEIAVFLDITLQNLYSRRKQLLKSVFNVVGKPDEFDLLVQELG